MEMSNLETFTHPTHYYLKNGKPYILKQMGKTYIDSKPSAENPNVVVLKDADGLITRLVGEWNLSSERYEYLVVEGLSDEGLAMKPFIELMRALLGRID